MACAPHQIKKIIKVCEMMLEHGDLEALDFDVHSLNDVRFDLMAIARRRLKASVRDEMNKELDAIDTEVLSGDHSHS